jgi:hypothetical protein
VTTVANRPSFSDEYIVASIHNKTMPLMLASPDEVQTEVSRRWGFNSVDLSKGPEFWPKSGGADFLIVVPEAKGVFGFEIDVAMIASDNNLYHM